ncbi:MAG TPA: sigma-70 family RNA polymerase sigma factor [Candidatus Polarisedimenticolaceae bacterium]|nr:sigma-70 family RNA polymerase sigma factor [Candidatus Polarisedimenticolaceae bacterium]
MARLADGDRSAFTPVFEILWPLLSSFARRVLGDAALAEDVAQHALVVVFAQASRFDTSHDAAAWAVAIAANECRNARRRRSRWAALPEDALSRPDPRDGPEAEAIARDLVEGAVALVGQLKPEDAAALEAVWRGEKTGLPPATLRKRVQRASERLRTLWRSRHGTT